MRDSSRSRVFRALRQEPNQRRVENDASEAFSTRREIRLAARAKVRDVRTRTLHDPSLKSVRRERPPSSRGSAPRASPSQPRRRTARAPAPARRPPARPALGLEPEQLARSPPRAPRGRRAATSAPQRESTSSGRPTSSLATTGTSIASASLTTTGIASRSPSEAITAGIASRSARLEQLADALGAPGVDDPRRLAQPRRRDRRSELGPQRPVAGDRESLERRRSRRRGAAPPRRGRRSPSSRRAARSRRRGGRRARAPVRRKRSRSTPITITWTSPARLAGRNRRRWRGRVLARRDDERGAAELLAEVARSGEDVVPVPGEAVGDAGDRARPASR